MSKYDDLKDKLAERFINCLNENQECWSKEWKQGTPPCNALTNASYHGFNRLILTMASQQEKWQGYRFATFNQIKEKGWHLKKGSKGVQISSPAMYKYYPDIENVTKWRYVSTNVKRDMIEKGEAKDNNFKFGYIPVWTVFTEDMIEGIDKELDVDQHIYSNDDKFNILKGYMDELGVDLYQSKINSECYFDGNENRIVLPPDNHFYSKEAMLATLAHEIAHSTGVPLGRDMSGRFGDEQYAKEELRAEIASAFICAELGIDSSLNINNNVAYIQSWSKNIKDDSKFLVDATNDAGKICDFVMQKSQEYYKKLEAKIEQPEHTVNKNKDEHSL